MRTLLYIFLAFIVVASLAIPSIFVQVVYAAEPFEPLIPIPGITDANLDTETYLENLYILAISIAAFIAVAKITLAGFSYIGTDIVTTKGSAKKDIQSAIIGLVIILAAVSILRVINPDIVNLPTLEAPAITTQQRVVVVNNDSTVGDPGVECLAEGHTPVLHTDGTWSCATEVEVDASTLLTPDTEVFGPVPFDEEQWSDFVNENNAFNNIPLERVIGYLVYDDRTSEGGEVGQECSYTLSCIEDRLQDICGPGNTSLPGPSDFNIRRFEYYCIRGNPF